MPNNFKELKTNYKELHEKDCIKEEDLPDEYRDAIHKINMTGMMHSSN